MTWTSRAAGRPRLQVGRRTSTGLERELGIRLCISLDGARAANWAAMNRTSRMALWWAILFPFHSQDILVCACKASARHAIDLDSIVETRATYVQSHDQSTSRGQSTLNRIQTTSRIGLSQTGFKPLWLNAHSRLDSLNANQCALNRIECALSVQCERALTFMAIAQDVYRK